MPLRDQPYLPLYIQDFMTDEKLIECSASATGIYIRIMCILHKQDKYGKLLLKQKYKQTPKQISNFAYQLATSLPYTFAEIESALNELLSEQVLHIDGEFLLQKRMVRDNEISEKRAKSGSKGGKKTTKKIASQFAQAKPQAKYENESEYESESKNEFNLGKSENPLPENNFPQIQIWIEELKTSDHVFQQKVMSAGIKISTTELIEALDDYEGLLAQYPAKQKVVDIYQFRIAALKHVKEYMTKKPIAKQKPMAEIIDKNKFKPYAEQQRQRQQDGRTN